MSKKYRVYRLYRDKSVSQAYFQQADCSPLASSIGEYRYITEVFDTLSGSRVIDQPLCEIAIIHMKLFKSSSSHHQDLSSILDDRLH